MRNNMKKNIKKQIPKKKAKKKTPSKSALSILNSPQKIGRPREWDEESINIERLELEKWIDNPKNYFITSFLNERKLHSQQVERFCDFSKEFCEAYARARQIQEQRIVEAALSRKFDGTFAKFVLQNKAGWKEKQEVSGDAANPLAVILDRIAISARDPLDYDE